jgi:DNA processing protein
MSLLDHIGNHQLEVGDTVISQQYGEGKLVEGWENHLTIQFSHETVDFNNQSGLQLIPFHRNTWKLVECHYAEQELRKIDEYERDILFRINEQDHPPETIEPYVQMRVRNLTSTPKDSGTYAIRELLKQTGYLWDGHNKFWWKNFPAGDYLQTLKEKRLPDFLKDAEWFKQAAHVEICFLNDAKQMIECFQRVSKFEIPTNKFENKKRSFRNKLEEFSKVIDGVVAFGDSNFPSHRGLVKNSEKPIALFYRGDLRLLDIQNKNVAVIGLINPDEDTERIEKYVVSNLVVSGATIVSGLALGCDSIAHRQALLSGGKTIAILPSPVNDILPHVNKDLAKDIVDNHGLLISEYYERANSKMELTGRYQERNRLQALFSDCVVLSASYAKNDLGYDSGSRLAMEYALNYSIPRAIMYDSKLNASNQKYDLNRQLIREDEKIIVINRDNVREALKGILYKFAKPPTEMPIQKDLF